MIFERFMGLSAPVAVIGTCLSTSAAAHSTDPSDPFASVPPARYQPVLHGWQFESMPAAPGDWSALNGLARKIGGPTGQFKDQDVPLKEGEQ